MSDSRWTTRVKALTVSCAVVVVVGAVFMTVRWNAHRDEGAVLGNQMAGDAEAPTTRDLLDALKSGSRPARDVVRALVQKPEGFGHLRLIARDETMAAETRAHAVAQLITTYPDLSPREIYTFAEQFVGDEDAEVRLAVASGLPAYPVSTRSVPLLASVIDDPDPRVRMRAAIKLLSIDAQRHEHWDYAFRQLLILLQSLPENPSIADEDVRCGLYRLSVTADDMTGVLDGMLDNAALRPSHREMAARWRQFVRDSNANKVAPPEFYDGCA
jgi:hypothetical protein